MNQPFKQLAARPKKLVTRLDIAEGDLDLFKEKTDQEVLDCEFVWDCIEKGYFDIPASWQEGCSFKQDTHECDCRPEWYLKQMKERHV